MDDILHFVDQLNILEDRIISRGWYCQQLGTIILS